MNHYIRLNKLYGLNRFLNINVMWELLASIVGGGIFNWITNSPEMKEYESDMGFTPWSWYQDQESWNRQQSVNQQNWIQQKSLNEQNIENQWRMWNASNAYNSPSAQMARFAEAGLNPNLIYGQQNVTSPVSVPAMQNIDRKSQNVIGEFNNYMQKIAELPFMKEKLKTDKANAKFAENKAEQINLYNRLLANQVLQSDYHTLVSELEGKKSLQLINVWDTLQQDFVESIRESFKKTGKQNKLLEAQEALHKANRTFIDLKKKFYDNMPDGSSGIFELQRQLLGLKKDLLDIDVDWKNAMNLGGAASPWLKFLLGLTQKFF